ncbi:Dps family protein [Sphingobacterium bovistauri]|uniref:DNA starvation/stationary phase protection protein n=1 Tax=Sphingobacterium bovistauri TaxID=2781959 RepID=A0ABS7Z3B4_9SPHI|nr:DNA starvation/stationary phase protection protein [Sphingobacterium bovistauri]MCA5004648.1 DNA starvation/stationary phase protection protein [Sphingobacterium bovistauri]
MKTNIGIKEKDTAAVTAILNKLLADHNVLYTKARNAHWNVVGPDFHAQHLFFETIYDALAETIDEIAERVRSIGHYAVGSLKEFLDLTQLSEDKPTKNDSQSYIKALLNDFESVIISIRGDLEKVEKTGDAGTEDFLVGIMEAHEKTAWMLRSHLA